MHRALIGSLLSAILAAFLYFFIAEKPTSSFIDTLYTTASIMFSIGMGVICTFNPEKIKNKSIYSRIKIQIISVRNNFLWNFGNITAWYIVFQYINKKNVIFSFHMLEVDVSLAATLYYMTLILISTSYFIYNFLSIQSLTFQIAESE